MQLSQCTSAEWNGSRNILITLHHQVAPRAVCDTLHVHQISYVWRSIEKFQSEQSLYLLMQQLKIQFWT